MVVKVLTMVAILQRVQVALAQHQLNSTDRRRDEAVVSTTDLFFSCVLCWDILPREAEFLQVTLEKAN